MTQLAHRLGTGRRDLQFGLSGTGFFANNEEMRSGKLSEFEARIRFDCQYFARAAKDPYGRKISRLRSLEKFFMRIMEEAGNPARKWN
ncbi:unnamed protein product [Gongylonema pulchrum]|uniref:Non-specific serine/threonine protein kinase n=1 Tax=Gongylonema pulchrum TaxID=637853 RepID=A0A183CY90_9BILA|nr:unnamed protein product [Gongylonema pulchrum]